MLKGSKVFSKLVNKIRGVESSEDLVARVKTRLEQSKPVVHVAVEDAGIELYEPAGVEFYFVSESTMSIEDFKNLK